MDKPKITTHHVTMPEDRALVYLDDLLKIVNEQFIDPGYPIALGMAVGALRRVAEYDKAQAEGRLIILPPSAKEGDPKPDCFEGYGGSLWCLGYQHSEVDDEPTDRCKRCWYCENGDYADDRAEAEAALGGGGDG